MADKRPRMRRPAAVGDLLDSAFQGSPTARCLREGAIWRVWGTVVGPQIASRAKPAAIRNGILTVHVASAPWLQQLNFLKAELRGKLNAALGEEMVREIHLKAGSVREEAAAGPSRRPRGQRRLTPSEEALVSQATAGISDPALRAIMGELFTRHLASQPDEAAE